MDEKDNIVDVRFPRTSHTRSRPPAKIMSRPLTVGSVVGVDLQVLDVRQTPMVDSAALCVLLRVGGLAGSCVYRHLGKLVLYVGRAHAAPQVGQRLFRLGRPVPG